MADYLVLAAIHILVGFEMFSLGFIQTGPTQSEDEAIFIIAFLCYLVAAILMVLVKGGGLGGNKPAVISTLVLAFLAALFILVGVCMWGADNGGQNSYVMTIDCVGMAMAVIGAIFLIMTLSGGGGSKTGP